MADAAILAGARLGRLWLVLDLTKRAHGDARRIDGTAGHIRRQLERDLRRLATRHQAERQRQEPRQVTTLTMASRTNCFHCSLSVAEPKGVSEPAYLPKNRRSALLGRRDRRDAGDRGLDLEVRLRQMAFGEEEVEWIGLALNDAERGGALVQIDRGVLRAVYPTQIERELVVDVDEQIVVIREREGLAPFVLELGVELEGEVVVVRVPSSPQPLPSMGKNALLS